MSWMDSWSRPNKQSATPPPLYLTSEDTKYCSTCGRVIGARRSHQKNKIVKYCSDGCRNHRPGPLDKRIDRTILSLLLGEEDSGLENTNAKGRFKKGDRRLMITCDEIEKIVFDRDRSHLQEKEVETDQDNNADAVDSNAADLLVIDDLESNASIADETMDPNARTDPEPKSGDGSLHDSRQQDGQRRADEREKVRRAARRAVVFGFAIESRQADHDNAKAKPKSDPAPKIEEAPRRKCEAVMNGQVVEPSFAKGNWAIRWRE